LAQFSDNILFNPASNYGYFHTILRDFSIKNVEIKIGEGIKIFEAVHESLLSANVE